MSSTAMLGATVLGLALSAATAAQSDPAADAAVRLADVQREFCLAVADQAGGVGAWETKFCDRVRVNTVAGAKSGRFEATRGKTKYSETDTHLFNFETFVMTCKEQAATERQHLKCERMLLMIKDVFERWRDQVEAEKAVANGDAKL